MRLGLIFFKFISVLKRWLCAYTQYENKEFLHILSIKIDAFCVYRTHYTHRDPILHPIGSIVKSFSHVHL